MLLSAFLPEAILFHDAHEYICIQISKITFPTLFSVIRRFSPSSSSRAHLHRSHTVILFCLLPVFLFLECSSLNSFSFLRSHPDVTPTRSLSRSLNLNQPLTEVTLSHSLILLSSRHLTLTEILSPSTRV